MRVIDTVWERTADVSSASPSSEQMRGLWVKRGSTTLKKKVTSEEMYEFLLWRAANQKI